MRATLVSSEQRRILLILFTDYVGRTRDEKPKVKFKGTSEDDNNSLYATVIGLFVGHVFADVSFSTPAQPLMSCLTVFERRGVGCIQRRKKPR